MGRFYEDPLGMRDGLAQPPGKPFAHPSYWAAFILIGDPN